MYLLWSHSFTFHNLLTIRLSVSWPEEFFLPKHPGAAQMLRDVGAVDFLTQLSPNVEPRLRAVIDGTLDQLFQLPDLLPSQAMAYVHGSHAGAPTGVASRSQIFFCSCFDSAGSDERFKIQGMRAVALAQMSDRGSQCFTCNISRWRTTSCGLFPQGWTEPSGRAASEDSRYWCFEKPPSSSFFFFFFVFKQLFTWYILLSARVCEMPEVFSVPLADADKHRQAYSLIQWEVRGRFVVFGRP